MRMGAHAWLLFATIITELLVIRKWGKNIYTQQFPIHIKWSLTIGTTLLVLYPLTRVNIHILFTIRRVAFITIIVRNPECTALSTPASKRISFKSTMMAFLKDCARLYPSLAFLGSYAHVSFSLIHLLLHFFNTIAYLRLLTLTHYKPPRFSQLCNYFDLFARYWHLM